MQRDDGLDVLDLSNRAYTALRRYRLMTVGAVLKAQADNYSEMPRIGPKVREELKRKLSRITVLEEEKVDYTGMLDSLTGLENVKEQMRKIAAFARMKKDMGRFGKEHAADCPEHGVYRESGYGENHGSADCCRHPL